MKLTLALLVLLAFFSCKSAPATPPPESPPPAATKSEKDRATEAMNKAKSIKAEVGAKAEYDQALTRYNSAESGTNANAEYLEAEKLFLAAYDAAFAKRQEAARQLELAKQAIKTVEADAAELEAQQKAEAEQGGVQ